MSIFASGYPGDPVFSYSDLFPILVDLVVVLFSVFQWEDRGSLMRWCHSMIWLMKLQWRLFDLFNLGFDLEHSLLSVWSLTCSPLVQPQVLWFPPTSHAGRWTVYSNLLPRCEWLCGHGAVWWTPIQGVFSPHAQCSRHRLHACKFKCRNYCCDQLHVC